MYFVFIPLRLIPWKESFEEFYQRAVLKRSVKFRAKHLQRTATLLLKVATMTPFRYLVKTFCDIFQNNYFLEHR